MSLSDMVLVCWNWMLFWVQKDSCLDKLQCSKLCWLAWYWHNGVV